MKRVLMVIVLIGCLFSSGCIYTMRTLLGVDRQRREQYVDQNPLMSATTMQFILAGKVHIGMTKEQVKASWGDPSRITRSVTRYGETEQWVYRDSLDDGIHVLIFNDQDELEVVHSG